MIVITAGLLGSCSRPSVVVLALHRGTPANGGDYDVTSDHWMTIAPTGTAIAVAFSLSRTGETTVVLASRSTDGDRHWQPPVTLQRDADARFFNDRPTVTADPFHRGRIYVAWDRIDDHLDRRGQPLHPAADDRAVRG